MVTSLQEGAKQFWQKRTTPQSSGAVAGLNEERPLDVRQARPARLPDIQRSFLSGGAPEGTRTHTLKAREPKGDVTLVKEKCFPMISCEDSFCTLMVFFYSRRLRQHRPGRKPAASILTDALIH